jgi:hypothetical protein
MVSAMGHVFPFSIPTHRVREMPSSPDPRPPIFFEILCGLLLSSSANKYDRMVSVMGHVFPSQGIREMSGPRVEGAGLDALEPVRGRGEGFREQQVGSREGRQIGFDFHLHDRGALAESVLDRDEALLDVGGGTRLDVGLLVADEIVGLVETDVFGSGESADRGDVLVGLLDGLRGGNLDRLGDRTPVKRLYLNGIKIAAARFRAPGARPLGLPD